MNLTAIATGINLLLLTIFTILPIVLVVYLWRQLKETKMRLRDVEEQLRRNQETIDKNIKL